jgi:hypothetical protein
MQVIGHRLVPYGNRVAGTTTRVYISGAKEQTPMGRLIMECAWTALLYCFSWANLYLDGGLSFQDKEKPYREHLIAAFPDGSEYAFTVPLDNSAPNPFGRVALGYQIDLRRVTLTLEASHTSSFASGDDVGINAISVNARWFPFRR